MARRAEYPGVRILPSGTIAYTIREPDSAGTIRHRTITRDPLTDEPFRTAAQAQRARQRHQARIEAGHRGRSRETLADYATAWLAARRDIRPSTRRTYALAIRHLSAHLGDIPISDLRPTDVRRLHAALADSGLAPGTVGLIHTALGTILESALTDDLIRRNPARLVRGPSVGRPDIQVWDEAEVRAFLAVADQHPYAALWRIAVETGMRIGELRALAWGDVNLRERSLTVRRTATIDADYHPTIGDAPKTEASRRTVLLSERVVAQLTAQRTTARSTLVFPTQRGQLLGANSLRIWLQSLCRAANVPLIRLHDLRHTAATLMLTQGTPVHVVAAILGHSTPSITLSIYAHALPSATRDAIERMARSIDG